MKLLVNGAPLDAPDNCTVSHLLEILEVRSKGVAVERNRQIIPRGQHEATVLDEGDQLEVVTLVGGG